MRIARLDRRHDALRIPLIDQCERICDRPRLGHDLAIRRQSDEAENHHPRQSNEFVAREQFIQPSARARMLGTVAVDRVHQQVRNRDDQRLPTLRARVH